MSSLRTVQQGWVVMRLFIYRKNWDCSIMSTHDSSDHADAWARWHCHKEHGEVYDVSDDENVQIFISGVKVYGPSRPWDAAAFYVEKLPEVQQVAPPFDPKVRLAGEDKSEA